MAARFLVALRPGDMARRLALRQLSTSVATEVGAFSHLDARGNARMVDVGAKQGSVRRAIASGRVSLGELVISKLLESGSPNAPKGDVLGAARIAGITAAKKTADLIPLCHQVPIAAVSIDFTLERQTQSLAIQAEVTTSKAQTGVEMEALTAVSVAALTVYDMCKALDKSMEITDIRLTHKSGGKSGDFTRDVSASRSLPDARP